jgi:hypothetical protein
VSIKEPEDDDYLTNYLDPYFGAQIADVISTWAKFEYSLDEFIWDLADLEDELGACLTSQFSSVIARFNAVVTLAKVKNLSESVLQKLNKLKDKALGVADKRNRVAHDPWFRTYESNNHYRLQKTARGKLDYDHKLVTEDELKAIVAEIDLLQKQFDDIRSLVIHERYDKYLT